MNQLQRIADFGGSNALEDILMLAGVDPEDESPLPDALLESVVFLDCGVGLIQLSSNRSEIQVTAELVERVDLPPFVDRHYRWLVVSLQAHFVRGERMFLTGMRCILDRESRPSDGIVRAIEFSYSNGKKIMADATSWSGLGLSGAGSYESWLEGAWPDERFEQLTIVPATSPSDCIQ